VINYRFPELPFLLPLLPPDFDPPDEPPLFEPPDDPCPDLPLLSSFLSGITSCLLRVFLAILMIATSFQHPINACSVSRNTQATHIQSTNED